VVVQTTEFLVSSWIPELQNSILTSRNQEGHLWMPVRRGDVRTVSSEYFFN
jgi:hypothetical protein